MKIWSKIRQNSGKKQTAPKKHTDIISALEEIESKTKAHLKIDLPNDVAEQVKRFLNEKGSPLERRYCFTLNLWIIRRNTRGVETA